MIASLQNKLINRWLWFKNCWWFTFSHKPLCTHYHKDTFKIGRLFVCRSCTLVYSSALITLIAALLLGSYFTVSMSIMLLCFTIGVTGLSYPPLYKRHSRTVRDILRSLLGVLIIASSFNIYHAPIIIWSYAPFTLLIICWVIFGKSRQENKRGKCYSCPEFKENSVCSGYEKQIVSVQAYQDKFAEILTKQRMR